MFGADDLKADFGFDLDRLAVEEPRPAFDDLDAGLLQQRRRRRRSGDRRCRPSTRIVLARSSCGAASEMPSGLSPDANCATRREFIGGMDQRLGRNAADVEAGSARLCSPRPPRCRCRAVPPGSRRHSRRVLRRSPEACRICPAWRQSFTKISAGVSSSALMCCTKVAASQPSMTR